MTTPVDRVRAFLAAYPHDPPTNLDPEVIYAYDGHELLWSDLDALVREAVPRALAIPDSVTLFEEFWHRYPRKVGKREAAKAFARLNGDQRALAARVIDGHVAMWIAEGRGTRLIPHASTWLNQSRFDDEIGYVPDRDVSPQRPTRHTRTDEVLNRMENP